MDDISNDNGKEGQRDNEDDDAFWFSLYFILKFNDIFQENQRARTVQRKRNLILQNLSQLKHHPKEVSIHDCVFITHRQCTMVFLSELAQ
jgi:hypothetical protein